MKKFLFPAIVALLFDAMPSGNAANLQIGRASCRERGDISVAGVQTCALPIYTGDAL